MTNLILVHGWGASGEIWGRQREYFQERATVLTPTLPVWEAAWLADFLQQAAPPPLEDCLVVGWSLGGMLVLEALSQLPEAAPGGLILVGVPPVFCRRPDYPWGQPPGVVRAMRRALAGNRTRVLEDFARQCLAPGEAAYETPARRAFDGGDTTADLAAGLDYLLSRDLRALLADLSPGAVVIQGQEDRIVPADQGRNLATALAGAKFELVPGAGHLPFMTQAKTFNRIVEKCLNHLN
jgi:pimeloyl-[acyl-carrier protein] methyl ester esterase